jgi:predicted nucleic acid-binding protein
MSDKVFLDTNILVYAYDRSDPEKQAKAQELLTRGIEQENAVISAQVLGEFFVVVTRRIQTPLSAEEAEQVIDLLGILPVVEVDLKLVRRTLSIHRESQISYRDSLIVAAAERAGCAKILSEDLNAGQVYCSVRVENPFDGVAEGA